MSDWYACRPCQICNEESKIVCLCTRVYLCENCLSTHLMLEFSAKHKPQLLNDSQSQPDHTEIIRQNVLKAINSKLQNEVLVIEEFKRISVQTFSDFIESTINDLREICEKLIRNIEEKCGKADQDMRDAISLSKLSLNVNHPILDLFKYCKSVNDVKKVEIVQKNVEYKKIQLQEIIDKHTCFTLEIRKDFNGRVLPLKSPAEATKKEFVKKSLTNITEDEFLFDTSGFKGPSKTFSGLSETNISKAQSVWTLADSYTSTTKTYIEMELQERPKAEAKPIKVLSDYQPRPLYIYKFLDFSEEILSLNVQNSQACIFTIPGEKFFPQAAWSMTEDEKLIISGGFDGNPRNSTVVYNLITNKAERAGNMVIGRYHHVLISLGKYIYAIGGISNQIVKKCERFSLEKKEWTTIGNLIIGRENPGACSHNNKVYICGGSGIESLEVFSPMSGKFNLLSLRLPSPGKCCVFPYDNFLYILQKENIYMVQTLKLALSTVGSVENNDWWSPCEAQVRSNTIFFCTYEGFYKLALDTHSVTLINFTSK